MRFAFIYLLIAARARIFQLASFIRRRSYCTINFVIAGGDIKIDLLTERVYVTLLSNGISFFF